VIAVTAPADPQRVCFTLRVRPDRAQEYRARHIAVWPEMRDALQAAGWRNYSIFLREDGTVIGYLECDDFDACVARMQEEPVNARWQSEMREFFALEGADAPDRAMAPLPEIFHLD
jgi:L-rhamnose mutarotase